MVRVHDLKLFTVLLVLSILSIPAFACIVYGGGVTYLNKPNVTVNLSAITQSNATPGANYTYSEGAVFFRSHYNDSLLISLSQDQYGWILRAGVPGASPYGQPGVNWSEAIWTELDWLWAHKVINGTTPEDVSQITDLLANNTGSYVYYKDGNWTAIQSNCFPDGNCVRCGPAGAGLNATLPAYGLGIPEQTDDEKVNACLAGLGLLLAPLFLFLRL